MMRRNCKCPGPVALFVVRRIDSSAAGMCRTTIPAPKRLRPRFQTQPATTVSGTQTVRTPFLATTPEDERPARGRTMLPQSRCRCQMLVPEGARGAGLDDGETGGAADGRRRYEVGCSWMEHGKTFVCAILSLRLYRKRDDSFFFLIVSWGRWLKKSSKAFRSSQENFKVELAGAGLPTETASPALDKGQTQLEGVDEARCRWCRGGRGQYARRACFVE